MQDRSCLEVGAKNVKRSWNNSGALTTAQAPKEPRLQRLLQPRERTHFFGSDWYLLQKPCLPNKLTSFSNLHVPWPKDCCLLIGQKLSHYSTCVTWTWGEFKHLIIWIFHVVFFSLLTIFPFTLIWRVPLSLSNLTCLSLCNENTYSRYIVWCIVSSSHNTLGSLCYGIKTTQGEVERFIHEKSLYYLIEKYYSPRQS